MRANLSHSLILVFTLAGCMQPFEEGSLKTEDLRASYSVYYDAHAGTVGCSAYLYTFDNPSSPVELEEGDVLTCNGEVMSRSSSFYYASIPGGSGASVSISLLRPREGTFVANVEIPPVATSILPPAYAYVTKGAPLTVFWSASSHPSDSMHVFVSNQRTDVYAVGVNQWDDAPESGSATFGAGQTQSIPSMPGAWPSKLRLTRTRTGTMPAGLSGEMTASSATEIDILLVD